jgi:hypothetical protein
VESTGRRATLEATLTEAGWDLTALGALGAVVYEDTRNRGSASTYAHLAVPHGRMFSAFELNRAYEETDVMVSLAKLKQHLTAGVTLSMKNMFGLTPDSMYGGKPGDEEATTGRGTIHDPRRYVDLELPGQKADFVSTEAGVRVPNTIVDLCAARPVDLAIIDGITSITQAESRYFQDSSMRVVSPGIIIAGTNAVSVDAVGAAVMGSILARRAAACRLRDARTICCSPSVQASAQRPLTNRRPRFRRSGRAMPVRHLIRRPPVRLRRRPV